MSVVQLFYCTGWDNAVAHHEEDGGWRDATFTPAKKSYPHWKVANITISASSSRKGTIEFVCRSADKEQWDKQPDGDNYVLTDVKPGNRYTLRDGVITKVVDERVMVVSDIDWTLVGHNDHLREFIHVWESEYMFGDSLLIYSTGRNLEDALQVARKATYDGHVDDLQLPTPDTFVSGAGTEIYHPICSTKEAIDSSGTTCDDSGSSKSDDFWAAEDRIEEDLTWKKQMTKTFDRAKLLEIVAKHAKFPHFELHGNEMSDPYRVPCQWHFNKMEENTPSIKKTTDAILAEVEKKIGKGYKVIVSGDGDVRFVDFVGSSGGKLMALEYLVEKYGFSKQRERVLICGDSGNDADMYTAKGINAVAVENAQPALLEHLETLKEGATVFHGERKVAGSVVDALRHFYPTC